MHEVVGLEQHVAEFGVADAGVAFDAAFDGVLGEHHVDRKVLTDVAEEFEVREASHPVMIVKQHCTTGTVEVEKATKLTFDAGDIFFELIQREQIALFTLSGWVADHACCTAHEGDGAMAGFLKAAKHESRQKRANVEAV